MHGILEVSHRYAPWLQASVLSLLLFVWTWPACGAQLTPREVYQQASPTVVFIFAASKGGKAEAGSGVILHQKGMIITNAHVVLDEATKRPHKYIQVYLKPEKLTGKQGQDLRRRYDARLLAYDAALDIALLQMLKPPPQLSVMVLAAPHDVAIGEPVMAIGHPETGGLWTLTTGVISAQLSDFQGVPGKDILQTEASLNRGNSGGPLLDQWGHMVGMATSISRRAADNLMITDINFALQAKVIRQWLASHDVVLAYGQRSRTPERVPATPPYVSVQPSMPPPITESPPKVDVPLTPSPTVPAPPSLPKPFEVQEPPEVAPPRAVADVDQDKHMTPTEPTSEQAIVPRPTLRPRTLTPKRPYNLRQLIEQRMQQIEQQKHGQ